MQKFSAETLLLFRHGLS